MLQISKDLILNDEFGFLVNFGLESTLDHVVNLLSADVAVFVVVDKVRSVFV